MNVVPLFGHLGAAAPNDAVAYALAGKTIKAGAPKAVVLSLQQSLASWGFSPGAADGAFGKNTSAAVKALQQKLGIGADGLFGPGTARAVQADLDKGAGSILRNQTPMMLAPVNAGSATKNMPAGAAARAVEVAAGQALPATAPATGGVPWLWIVGGLAAIGALYWFSRDRDSAGQPYAPPGSVVADLGDEGDEEYEDDEEPADDVEVEEPEPA